jgi:preprotein translocase subunit SecA
MTNLAPYIMGEIPNILYGGIFMKKRNFILTIETTEINNVDGCIDREDKEYERFYNFDEMMEFINQYAIKRIERSDLWYTTVEIKPVYMKSKIIFTVDNGEYHLTKIFKWEKL